ncbi:hypothetical protein A134_23245 [Vibrio crassostreae 9CS106]|uniref:Uncharacterized protein n=1 Tax=Vibrio crassostreae 9CS106 TaxID=1191300 RepID=A0A1B1C3C2_9VIBR|nr:hypothetical protein A134_23245 [Vibrio crassostreae 9CS106]
MLVESYQEEEFYGVATKRFGDSMLDWAFVCPLCGTRQTIGELSEALGYDLDEIKANKALPDEVRKYIGFSCLGRFNQGEKGCDWTLGGLFKIHTTEVISEDGEPKPIFELAQE